MGNALLDLAASSGRPAGAAGQPDGATERESKGERTRRRLLEIAVQRFGARGFRATSVSEIAREAGVTQAAVYAYFENKDALFDAAVDHDAAEAITTARARAEDIPANQIVPILLMFVLAEMEAHPLARRVIAGNEPDVLKRLVELPALGELTDFIEAKVLAAQASGEVRSDIDAGLFASGAETILLSLCMSITQVGSSTVPRRQMGVVTIFDAVLRAPSP